jgi:hypothetical protein
MGLGLNAAHRKEFRDYQLHKLPIVPGQTSQPIELVPTDLPDKRIDVFKSEFAVWITGCGLRELTEHYALFLDQIHAYALAVLQQREKLAAIGDPEKLQIEFNRRFGIRDKLKALRKRFGIETEESDAIEGLYEARNCLTHDFGNVLPKRYNSADAFVLRWRALDLVARGVDTGEERPLVDLIGKVTSEETDFLMKVAERKKSFKVGDKLGFSQQDLWEICYFFNAHAIPSMQRSFLEF